MKIYYNRILKQHSGSSQIQIQKTAHKCSTLSAIDIKRSKPFRRLLINV